MLPMASLYGLVVKIGSLGCGGVSALLTRDALGDPSVDAIRRLALTGAGLAMLFLSNVDSLEADICVGTPGKKVEKGGVVGQCPFLCACLAGPLNIRMQKWPVFQASQRASYSIWSAYALKVSLFFNIVHQLNIQHGYRRDYGYSIIWAYRLTNGDRDAFCFGVLAISHWHSQGHQSRRTSNAPQGNIVDMCPAAVHRYWLEMNASLSMSSWKNWIKMWTRTLSRKWPRSSSTSRSWRAPTRLSKHWQPVALLILSVCTPPTAPIPSMNSR